MYHQWQFTDWFLLHHSRRLWQLISFVCFIQMYCELCSTNMTFTRPLCVNTSMTWCSTTHCCLLLFHWFSAVWHLTTLGIIATWDMFCSVSYFRHTWNFFISLHLCHVILSPNKCRNKSVASLMRKNKFHFVVCMSLTYLCLHYSVSFVSESPWSVITLFCLQNDIIICQWEKNKWSFHNIIHVVCDDLVF